MERYSTIKKSEKFYLITENYAEDSCLMISLVIGENKAALIDSGMGLFGTRIRDIVTSLTDHPVINLLTHGHPDHIGGSILFDEVYMNERDDDQIARLDPKRRLGDAAFFSHNDGEVIRQAEAEILDCSGFTYSPLHEGQIFDLGGVTLQVLTLPGHSQGSCAFWWKEENIVFSGDAFSKSVPASSMPDIEHFHEMAEQMKKFLETIDENAVIYHGHSTVPVERDLVTDEMICAKEIAEGKTEEDEEIFIPISPVPHQKKHIHGQSGISYNPAILNK